MSRFWFFLVIWTFSIFSCSAFSFQSGVVPPGVKVAKTSQCGEEVRTDDGILLPILKSPIDYPEFLAAETEDVFWVLIKFDVGVNAAPKNISVEGTISEKLKNYFKGEFSKWRFPPCNSGDKVSEILGEKILMRISR